MNTNEENKEQKINVEGEEKVTVDETTEESAQNGQDDNQEETQEKDPLEAANEQIEELKDKYLRAVAEFDNYKKRTLKEKTELILNGGEKTIVAILPILDDMERAAASAEKTDDIKALEEGWELIFKKLKKILESMGVKEIETKDADFNVDFHEAIAMVPGMGDDKKGKVIDCVQTGYTMNDKVIRHAKVAVGQ
ncbi:MAG: nucleotide exchange factor GrpE [Prevotella sp.]|nr:nucleotide exchange factor GrpE [Prevotella sp.]MCI6500029.1 nucleotide exchange factor GrpE [Prevotella sp.]MCI7687627.1 nucleotide exchange factor GrpE [Prevotella sp.]MDD6591044.1 nucleotide exchange factor GrpE [Prevotella sp.]MDD6671116.1 nucleotide exchange factor GrpE [Prevotella sp.]